MLKDSFILFYMFITMLIATELSCVQPCGDGIQVEVPAKPKNWIADVFTPTRIQIKKGDTISFAASGRWNAGLGYVSAEGKRDWCECPVRERVGSGYKGNVGALIGRIGKNGKSFMIGSRSTKTATKEKGVLYLSSNDNLAPCDGVNRGSCYDDNIGSIRVCVEIK